MKWFVSAASLALVIAIPAAMAQSAKPETAPSAQNSGAGIPGKPGSKSGPSVKSGTVGSSATTNQENPTVRQQDPTGIQGKPGNKSGPPAKPQ